MPNKKSAKPKVNLADAIYHDEDAARAHLEALLWGEAGATCPRCGQFGDRVTKLMGASTRPGVYKCKDCRKPFSVTVGTVMERSHIPLTKWVQAAQLVNSSKKGMSAKQLERMLGTNYESAWFLAHRLREAMKPAKGSGPKGGEGKVVEADETYVGGKNKNKHVGKRDKNVKGGSGKETVFALVERGGEVRSHHVTNVRADNLRGILTSQISRKTSLMTDDAGQYRHMGETFARHEVVNHKEEEYVRGDAHTNTIESYFAILKRGIYGQYHAISKQHLARYMVEFDYKYNTRHLTDVERANGALRGAMGKRLTYHQTNPARYQQTEI